MAGTSVLYLAPLARTFDELTASLEQFSWICAREVGPETHWVGAGLDVKFERVSDPVAAAERIRGRYYSLVVVDCRHVPGTTPDQAACQERSLHQFLERLRTERDPDLRFPFERVAVLIGGGEVDRTDRLLFDAGAHHVGLCLRDGSLAAGLAETAARRQRGAFLHELWDLAQTVLVGRKLSRSALCAAGGGITGIFYELGVLKCLRDAFANLDVRDFDMFFGISAGAVVTSLLANRVSIEEMLRDFARRGSPLEVELTLRHINYRDVPRRILSTADHMGGYLKRVWKREEVFSAGNLSWQLAALLGPIFDTTAIEKRFRDYLSGEGRTNDFRQLDCGLFIGATDHDERVHVLFGDEHHREVPISKAVQASAAIHPFFRPVEIADRYYTDGFVTRTSNLSAAIERGANLVFVIDPFLPVISGKPGENARHGMLWGVLQDYKTVAFTRFEQVTRAILRQNPQVTCFTFVPSNRMRQLMARNPMAATDYHPLVIEAYRSTYRRLRKLETMLGPRLQEHGIDLDLANVAHTIEALDRARLPRVEVLIDPDRKRRLVLLPRLFSRGKRATLRAEAA